MGNVVVNVKDVTMRYNISSQKVDNLKEYFIKFVKKEIMYNEFLALNDVSFQVKKRRASWNSWTEWCWKKYTFKSNCRCSEAVRRFCNCKGKDCSSAGVRSWI